MDVKIEYDRDKTGHYGNYTDKRSKKKRSFRRVKTEVVAYT
jgi:hypothetical protein